MKCKDCQWWDKIADSDELGVCLQILIALDSEYKGCMTRPHSGHNAVHLKTVWTFGCTMFEPIPPIWTRIERKLDEVQGL